MTMDKRTIKQPYIPYKEIDDGFEVFTEDGKNIITFEKAGGFTKETFRSIIIERYKNGQIRKICQTCKRDCKQIKVKGSSFKCFQKEYDYKKRKRQEKK
jgi:hypothetical protein